jgi:hypothetical protein
MCRVTKKAYERVLQLLEDELSKLMREKARRAWQISCMVDEQKIAKKEIHALHQMIREVEGKPIHGRTED